MVCAVSEGHTYIKGHSGRRYHADPSRVAEEWNVEDYARGLHSITRWRGATGMRISVAAHSIFVAQFCPPQHALEGLLHDTGEFFVGDIPAPFKKLPALKGAVALEKRLHAAILAHHGIKETKASKGVIKIADMLSRQLEIEYMANPSKEDFEAVPPVELPFEVVQAARVALRRLVALDDENCPLAFVRAYNALREQAEEAKGSVHGR